MPSPEPRIWSSYCILSGKGSGGKRKQVADISGLFKRTGLEPPGPRGLTPGFFFLPFEKEGEGADEDDRRVAISLLALVAGPFTGFFPDLHRGAGERDVL